MELDLTGGHLWAHCYSTSLEMEVGMSVAMETLTTLAPTTAVRPRIMSRALALVFMVSFGAAASFYLLLSVVPMYAASVGVGGVGAGLATGALMASTVATELVTPRLVARFGYRAVLAGGLVLLGAPALALPGSKGMATILLVCVVRGVGFAIAIVVGGALVASLVPPQRRGEGLGISGVVVGVPAVVALPLGVWLVGHAGYQVVFVAGAVAALAGLAAVRGLPGRQPEPERGLGVLAGLRTPALLRPSTVFSTTAMAAGVVVTFLPIAVGHASGNLAAVALLAQPASSTLSRWWAGRYGDQHGAARLLGPAVFVSAAGILALVLVPSPTAMVIGMVVFGAGFGVAQNASLSLMFDRVPASGYGAVSAVWNLAYDAGMGLGAAGFGLLIGPLGYSSGFALTACVLLASLPLARRQNPNPRSR
jgi:predicted MFS family arabinose efflux permease